MEPLLGQILVIVFVAEVEVTGVGSMMLARAFFGVVIAMACIG
jgi:hypothetical protein